MLKVPVINKSNNALPEYATSGSAGFDFCANVTEVKEKLTWNCSLSRNINGKIVEITIYPGGRALIPTGLHMANSFGVIDADYRGDIGLIVQNNGFEPFTVQQGDKIGQGIIYKCEQAEFTLVDELDKTERGEGGYGHTGVRN